MHACIDAAMSHGTSIALSEQPAVAKKIGDSSVLPKTLPKNDWDVWESSIKNFATWSAAEIRVRKSESDEGDMEVHVSD